LLPGWYFEDIAMEVIVYAVYLVGILAAFSALVVRIFAAVPTEVLSRGEHGGRFADLGAAAAATYRTPNGGSRRTTFDLPKARAA
jgi:uncharacterized membrane protein